MLAALLGSLVGIVLGLTGAGGSIFAVPLLVVGLGWALPQATPVALVAVCGAAIVGTVTTWRSGLIARRAALVAGAMGSLTAPLGTAIAARIPQHNLVIAFAVVMVIVALRMLRQSRTQPEQAGILRADPLESTPGGAAVCRTDMATSRLGWTRPCAVVLGFAGAVTGLLSGALGVGAGFVVVPTLRMVTELSMQSCVATSLMTIAIVSAAAVAAHVAVHGSTALPLLVAGPFVAGALAGMLASQRIAPRLSGPRLQQLFAGLMIVAATLLLWREFAGLPA